MKIITAGVIVTICGILQIAVSYTSLMELRNDLVHKQTAVWNLTIRLLDVQEKLTSSDPIDEDKSEFYRNISSIFSDAMDTIEDAATTAIAAGKVAGPCYDTAKASLEALNTTTFIQFDDSKNNSTYFDLRYLHGIDTVLAKGQLVASYLVSIPLTCRNTDLVTFELCIADLALNTTAQIESYYAAAERYMRLQDPKRGSLNVRAFFIDRKSIREATIDGVVDIAKTASQCISAL